MLVIAGIGLAMIYSTTYVRLPDGTGRPGREFATQMYALGIGGIALVVCLMLDYRKLAEHSLFLFAALVALLVFVLVSGDSAGGAQRWIESRPLQGAAVRIRPGDAGAGSRHVLR